MQGKGIREKARVIVDHLVLKKSLRDIAYQKMDSDNKAAADMIPQILNDPERSFSTWEEVRAAERALSFQSFTGVDFVTPEERITLLKKIQMSESVVANAIDSNETVQEATMLFSLLRAKTPTYSYTQEQSNQENTLIQSILESHLPRFAERLETTIISAEKTYQGKLNNSNLVPNNLASFLVNEYEKGLKQQTKQRCADALGLYAITVNSRPALGQDSMHQRWIYEAVIANGSPESKAKLKESILDVINNKDHAPQKIIENIANWLMDNPPLKNKIFLDFKNDIVQTYLKSKGLDPVSFVSHWNYDIVKNLEVKKTQNDAFAQNMETQDRLQIVSADNLTNLIRIEASRPGAVRYLNNNFGIVFFGRYETKTLIRQYDQRDEKAEWGIYVNAYPDHNFSAYSDGPMLEKMAGNLGNSKLRIMEVGSKRDLLHLINQGRHKYGKLKFGIISGHGTTDSIQLSYDDTDSLTSNDVSRKGFESISLAFTDDAIIMLNSCDTGKWFGIASQASGILRRVVYGPRVSTSIIDFKYKKVGGKNEISPIYDGAKGARYNKGRGSIFS